jgi:kynurenine formamidase
MAVTQRLQLVVSFSTSTSAGMLGDDVVHVGSPQHTEQLDPHALVWRGVVEGAELVTSEAVAAVGLPGEVQGPAGFPHRAVAALSCCASLALAGA